jgi:hypothetical protein
MRGRPIAIFLGIELICQAIAGSTVLGLHFASCSVYEQGGVLQLQ